MNEVDTNKKSKFNINMDSIVEQVMGMPNTRIRRDDFLHIELDSRYTKEIVKKAIEQNPASAGIKREDIDQIAEKVINYEAHKISLESAFTSIPGGLFMALTIPADTINYFRYCLRITQELAYLYGYTELEFIGNKITADSKAKITEFLGVMFGVSMANLAVRKTAEKVAKKVGEKVSEKGIELSLRASSEVIGRKIAGKLVQSAPAKIAKAVPGVAAVFSGGLTWVSFKKSARKLQGAFQALELSDPDFYRNQE